LIRELTKRAIKRLNEEIGFGSLLSNLNGLSADFQRIEGPSNYLGFVRITHRPRLGPSLTISIEIATDSDR